MVHVVKVVKPPDPPHDCWLEIAKIDGKHLGLGSIVNCCGKLYIKAEFPHGLMLQRWQRYTPKPGETDDAH